ncbi:MAG: tetratricopeptide repeat protein [Anaerohalosphaeraceae bacterium]|nr:tetratricopeptide repeat protein [Anaerohalosphaeraceae bacterium]
MENDIDNNVSEFDVLQEFGNRYASVGNYAQAQDCYEKAASVCADEPAPYIGMGMVALSQELLSDAELSFRVARRLDNDCSAAYSGIAMVAQKRGDYERAFEMFLKSLELDSDNLKALLGLFQTSCQIGSFAKVIYYLEIYLDMHPNDTSVMFSLAAFYVKEDRFDSAKKMLLEILKRYPNDSDAADLLEEVEHNLSKKQLSEV